MKTFQKISGFTLIELMIAMLIGIILLLGIATIFTNTTNNIRLQQGIANIQENGRIVTDIMTSDISGTGSQYCTALNIQLSLNGFTPQRPILSTIFTPVTVNGNDDLVTSYTTTLSGLTGGLFYGLIGPADFPPPAPTTYMVSGRYMIQGHNCVGSVCTPLLTAIGAGRRENGDTAANDVVGPAAGNRVPGTDVLTVRTLVGNGASIASSLPNGYNLAPNSLARLGLNTPTARLQNRLVLIADCNKIAILRGTFAGDTLTLLSPPTGANTAFSISNNARVFDMENQWLTVTYFLQFVQDPNTAGRVIPALMRRENGRALEEIARGVERLDFRYAVNVPLAGVNPENNLIWQTADQVQNSAFPCPRPANFTFETGCMWRAVTAVEVGMSLNTINGIANSDDRRNYTMENERDIAVADRMLHREFRFVVPIKSWAR
jgi:type IV pilus assembly protein PilW